MLSLDYLDVLNASKEALAMIADRHTFKMAAITLFLAQKCYHLVSTHVASALVCQLSASNSVYSS